MFERSTPMRAPVPSRRQAPATTARSRHRGSGVRLAVLMLALGAAACSAGPSGSASAVTVSANPSTGAASIASPDYALDLALTVEVDVHYVVQSVTGTATLLDGSTPGGGYYVDQGVLPTSPTYAELDSAQSNAMMIPIRGANPSLDASRFGLLGVDLTAPAVRTIVIQRVVADVRSYQSLAVTFSHP